MSFDYRMIDVLPLLGIEIPPQKTSFNIPCPVCDTYGHGQHLNINLKKNTFRCPKCGSAQGGVLDLYALYAGCSRGAAYRAVSNSIGITAVSRPEYRYRDNTESELAPVVQRDTVYRALLSVLPLSQEHNRNLHIRGLTDEQICEFGFRSAIPSEMNGLARTLEAQGYQMKGVPGFYRCGGNWMLRCDYAGILIPVLDADGLIQGLQIRLDSCEKRKYRWISSGGLDYGTGAASFAHYIGPQSDNILLTEGPLKADVIHALSGKTVLAVPGVNSLSRLKPVLELLQSRGTIHISTAFDMDFFSNPNVRDGYMRLKDLIEQTGFSCSTCTWDPDYKGLDDYLKAIMGF